jgi:hypothetical protein
MDARPCHVTLALSIVDTCIAKINLSRKDLADFENYDRIKIR